MFDADSSEEWGRLAYWMRNAAFEQCPEPLMLLDPLENKYIDCNIAATQMLGFDRQDILKMPISYIHGRELGQLIVFTQEALQRGHAKSKRIPCRLKNDMHIPVELSASRTVIKGREYLVVSIKDIDSEERQRDKADADRLARNGILEWKHLQSIFQQGERDNLLMLTSVGDGIYCVDTNGLCTFINPAAKRLLGRTDGDVLGQNIHYVHHHTHDDGTHYPVEDCPIYAAIRDGVVHEGIQEVFWKQDGTPFPVEFTSTPIISGGSIIGAVVVFRDISQRMETEKQLRDALKEVSELKARLEDENAYLQQEILIEQRYHGIIGESTAIKRIHQQIELVAQTEANVLITGESGTGKELIARAIHDASNRKDKPMIRVNCAAIPHELFESEFFGHIRGAFTGAVRDRIGRFELANGGTLFLDEVGEIPLELQSKLLRVLQEGQLERVGEEKTRNVDVRIIAATNKDLKKEAEAHHFREDLYFRLNVFPIHSPPLRERGNDITLLATHFLEQASQKFSKKECKLRQSDLKPLLTYNWPGNIRELQNVMERAAITSHQGRVTIDLPLTASATEMTIAKELPSETGIIGDDEMQERVKRNMLAALEQCDWKLFGDDGAAALLKLKPTTLASRIKRLGLKR
ncbi:sigma 54-interacting transcriptional regulator [Cellvibrio fibrivorans]|uniref:PAS domain S-box-containing protein n=1 Tax=Cellvibrio fibrivorans TaxID=126350 RepID=A0ABU1UYZ7_9GAMM|nr:sigma 54-interacting transcriptional regulator [Cellvibrio fibrivorans]MDR7090432.1 PAS domain S-box-containing protein [Cellvibrio fibrivorans]